MCLWMLAFLYQFTHERSVLIAQDLRGGETHLDLEDHMNPKRVNASLLIGVIVVQGT